MIRTGRAEVLQRQGNLRVLLTEIGPGEGFGELALLRGVARSATVRAIEPLQAFVLNRELLRAVDQPPCAVARAAGGAGPDARGAARCADVPALHRHAARPGGVTAHHGDPRRWRRCPARGPGRRLVLCRAGRAARSDDPRPRRPGRGAGRLCSRRLLRRNSDAARPATHGDNPCRNAGGPLAAVAGRLQYRPGPQPASAPSHVRGMSRCAGSDGICRFRTNSLARRSAGRPSRLGGLRETFGGSAHERTRRTAT